VISPRDGRNSRPIPVSRRSPGLFPRPPGIGVRVVSVRGDGADISGAQVIDAADQLEFVRVRLIWAHAAIVGRLSDGPAWPRDLLVFCLAGPGLGDVYIFGLRMRVAPCRVLAHYFLRCRLSARADLDYLPGLTAPSRTRRPLLHRPSTRPTSGMPVRLRHTVIDAHDLRGLARFWTQVLGWKVLSERENEVVIGTDENAPGSMCFMPVTDPKTVKDRVHLDLTSSAADRDQEIDRLLALGLRRVDIGQSGAESWTVLADPEGTSSA
jgi:hypothetical protein